MSSPFGMSFNSFQAHLASAPCTQHKQMSSFKNSQNKSQTTIRNTSSSRPREPLSGTTQLPFLCSWGNARGHEAALGQQVSFLAGFLCAARPSSPQRCDNTRKRHQHTRCTDMSGTSTAVGCLRRLMAPSGWRSLGRKIAGARLERYEQTTRAIANHIKMRVFYLRIHSILLWCFHVNTVIARQRCALQTVEKQVSAGSFVFLLSRWLAA
jgi:hypothetical protein